MTDLPLTRKGGRGPRNAASVEAVQLHRQARVAELWVRDRKTIAEIAEALGVSSTTVSSDRKAIVQRWREEAAGAYTELVLCEWKRLDALERDAADWMAETQDHEQRCRYIDRIVKIGESRRKLLGLDAPQRFQVLDEGGAESGRGVIVDLDGIPAMIPGPDDRDGFEAAVVEAEVVGDDDDA